MRVSVASCHACVFVSVCKIECEANKPKPDRLIVPGISQYIIMLFHIS